MVYDKNFYGIDENYFTKADCLYTAQEIAQQPMIWKALGFLLSDKKSEIEAFHQRLGPLDKIRIIFTGAGSSAFIGDALAPLLAKTSDIKAESIATTDIVTSPHEYLFEDIPTLLISFARSGNSPESMGAVIYARKHIKDLYEVAIICDGTSKLADLTKESEKSLTLVMPEGSCDRGFAMTSSVTCMMLSGFTFFNNSKTEEIVKDIELLSGNLADASRQYTDIARERAKDGFSRIVYIGSGFLKHIAHEAALKMLELTNGTVNGTYESATGFRHGPKSVINDETLTVHIISIDPFTALYDIDLLKEVASEKKQNRIISIGTQDDLIEITSKNYTFAGDLCTGIQSLVFCQMFAMFKSIELGITADNPSPTGEVNRVVKGVTIYDY